MEVVVVAKMLLHRQMVRVRRINFMSDDFDLKSDGSGVLKISLL